jgi:CheY-like chemotaxis protein
LIVARVLLIDDDRSNLDFMRQLLHLEGHELVLAADGKQGIALMRQFHPDLIICDVIMPHLGGYAVLETVRADPQFSGVPVLLFSAAMNEEARFIGLRRGATEVLAKPFELEQLRGAIRRCLGQEPR